MLGGLGIIGFYFKFYYSFKLNDIVNSLVKIGFEGEERIVCRIFF